MAKTKTKESGGTDESAARVVESIDVLEIRRETVTFCVLGTTPLILNRVSQKAARELLMPARKKNAAERAITLKHDPLAEFRASAYLASGDSAPTRLLHLSTAFKGALRSVATDIPGATKAQIGRLAYIPGEYVPIYGVPKLFMSITRNADMNRTPDVRTRAIVPEWAAHVKITYAVPLLTETAIARLFAAAGLLRGVGDWRPEKGAGDYGCWSLVSSDDEDWNRIVRNGGRTAQDRALEHPEPHDAESAELLAWWSQEVQKRGSKEKADGKEAA